MEKLLFEQYTCVFGIDAIVWGSNTILYIGGIRDKTRV